MKPVVFKAEVPDDFKINPQYYAAYNGKLKKWERQKVKFEVVSRPTDEEIQQVAFDFPPDKAADSYIFEVAAFRNGGEWMRSQIFGEDAE